MSALPSQQAVSAAHDIELTTSPEADSHGDRVPLSLAQDGMAQLQRPSSASAGGSFSADSEVAKMDSIASRDAGDVAKRFAQANCRDLNHILKGVDISSLSFSPDSKYLATGGYDGFARVFDVGSGEEKLMTLKHEGTVTSLCYSPNGKCFATVCDGHRVVVGASEGWSCNGYSQKADGGFARIFDVSGKEILKTKERLKFFSVSFAPDCMRIATGCEKGGVRIFDVANGEELMKIDESSPLDPSDGIKDCYSVCFSPDGKCLARDSGDGFVRIVDASNGREILKSERFTYSYDDGRGRGPSMYALSQFSLCFSPEGKNLAICFADDLGVRICSVANGQEIMKFAGISACFSTDGKSIATIDRNGLARIFDLATGKEMLKTVEHEEIELLTHIFDLATAKEIMKAAEHESVIRERSNGKYHRLERNAICFSPDKKCVATCSRYGFAQFFNVAVDIDSPKIMHHDEKEAEILLVCVSPDGKYVATSAYKGFARIFDVASGKAIFKFPKKASFMCFSPDSKNLAVFGFFDSQHVFCVYEVPSCSEICKTVIGSCKSACFSADGKFLASIDSKAARILDTATGEEIRKLMTRVENETSVGQSYSISPDFKRFAIGYTEPQGYQGGFARIFDFASGEVILKTERCKSKEHSVTHEIRRCLNSVCFSPDGKYFATGSDDGARIFDADTGNEILKTEDASDWILSVTFSPDGKVFAACTYISARIFHVDVGDRPNASVVVKPFMTFVAASISFPSLHFISLGDAFNVRVVPFSHLLASKKTWLPVPCSTILEWVRLPLDLQMQSFLSDSRVLLSEYFASDGGALVFLASKWQDPQVAPNALPVLKRLFRGQEPVFNAGLILRELLKTMPDSKDLQRDETDENTSTTTALRNISPAKVLPDSEAIELLLRNVSLNVSSAVHDTILTQQLARAACFPSIRSVIGEFWCNAVELVPSNSIVVHNVDQVSFSETTRMYVAGSDSTSEPIFENHFKTYRQVKGPPLDFQHFLVPFPDASAHRDASDPSSADGNRISLMQALVETNNIDIFGTVAVRAIVQHKWQTFGLALWLKEFCIYCLGLAFLVALGILDWRNWQLQPDRLNRVPPADAAVISALFCVVIIRSLYRETKQFVHSIPDGDGSLLRRILNSDHLRNFWNLLDLLHITLGISAVALVWAQSPKALPVLAITSFLRWWGTLFYLQAFDKPGPYVRMLVEIVKAIRWFLLIMLISILATWNAFTLLLKRQCLEPGSDATCESSRDAASVFRTMYDMINALLFGSPDLVSLENTEYFGLVVFIFITSMITMPIVLLNMLIAIMGDSYELIQDRSLRESVMMKANILLEIELFMSDDQKCNGSYFPKYVHVIVPKGEIKDGPSEYQGLMNALKRKIDDGSRDTNSEINELRKEMKQETLELKQELKDLLTKQEVKQEELLTKLTADHEKQVQELQGQVAEMLQIIRSRP